MCALDGEREGAPGFFAPVVDGVATAFDPFGDAAIVDSLEADERVSKKGEAPTDRPSNVDTQKLAVNAGRGIAESGQRHSAQRRPKQGRRRNETTRKSRTRHSQGVGYENRRAAAEAAAEKEIESSAIGTCHACDPFSSSGDVPIHELPIEDDLSMDGWKLRTGDPGDRWRASERSKPWRARDNARRADDQKHGARRRADSTRTFVGRRESASTKKM